MADKGKNELISVQEAAQRCGRNPETVRRWIWNGKLPAQKLGNQLFIRQGALESYCRETAIRAYDANKKADFLKRAVVVEKRTTSRGGELTDGAGLVRNMREERMDEVNRGFEGAAMKVPPGDRSEVIKRMKALREQIRARIGRDFTDDEISDTIESMREERDREISGLR